MLFKDGFRLPVRLTTLAVRKPEYVPFEWEPDPSRVKAWPPTLDTGHKRWVGGVDEAASETVVHWSRTRPSRDAKPPNVKHQRARATASRVKDEVSLRALRCMR